MTKKKKFQQLFSKGTLDDEILFRPILIHFAARYIGKTYKEFASDYKTLVESNLRCLEDFDLDAVGLISDPYRETSAFGAKITFPDEAVPRCEELIIKTLEDVKLLKNPDVYKAQRTLDRINAAKLLCREVGNEVPVIGWVEGPLAEACDLAGINEVLLNLLVKPDFVKLLIEKTTVTAMNFAKAQIDSGCDIIGVGDAICSQISQDNYKEFVKDKHAELFNYIHGQGAKVKLHICGNISHLLADLKQTGPDIVDIDHMVNMDEAYDVLGPDIVRCGNIDPVTVIQNQNENKIAETVKVLCKKELGKRFILSGGCEITVLTPPLNLKAMRDSSRAF